MLTFNATNTEIKVSYSEQLETGKLFAYTVDFNKATAKGMVPVGFIQKLDNVPSRGNGSSDAAKAFEGSNFLADMLGTNTFSSGDNIYRARILVNEDTAKALKAFIDNKKPIEGMELIVEDSTTPFYNEQKPAIYKDGTVKTHQGEPIYTNVAPYKIGAHQHTVLTLDAKEEQNSLVNSIAKGETVADLMS